jgi:hypothetical protein
VPIACDWACPEMTDIHDRDGESRKDVDDE